MYHLVYTYSTHVSWVTELCQESLLVRFSQDLIHFANSSNFSFDNLWITRCYLGGRRRVLKSEVKVIEVFSQVKLVIQSVSL